MSRAEEFRRLQRELTERYRIGSAELQAIYLGQIADILASIADRLEMKGENNEHRTGNQRPD